MEFEIIDNINQFDFIIIGGGICGLHIAALCSNFGRVLLLEKSLELGGRVKVLNHNGFLLDFGPHPVRFGPKSALALSFKELKIKNIKFIKPGLMYAYLNDGTKHIFPSGIKGALKTKMIPKFKTIKLFLKLYKDYKKDPLNYLEMPLKTFFKKYNVEQSIQKFILIASASMQVNPFIERSSIGELLENFKQVLKRGSIFYPDGGWQVFINAFHKKIQKNKGIILLNSEVKKIIIENETAIGVEIINTLDKSSKIFYGNKIISTIPVQNLFDILDHSKFPNEFVEKCKNLRPTSGISIDFCLSQKITSETLIFIEDPPSFGFIPSNLTKKICPVGKSIMSFFMPVNKEIIENSEQRKLLYNKFKEKIFSLYPNITKFLEFERPLFLQMVDGVEIAIDQNRLNRPKNSDHKIKNLYLTGDSIGGEGAGGDVGHNSVREIYLEIKKQMKK